MTLSKVQPVSTRAAFGRRLQTALARAGKRPSASLIRRALADIGSAGGGPTIFATRKWLRGEAIPVQHHVRQLATWLQVAPAWLMHGEVAGGSADGEVCDDAARAAMPRNDCLDMLAELALLDAHDHRIATEFIELLLQHCGDAN